MNGFVNGLCRLSRCPSRSAEWMECRVPTGCPLPAPDPRCPPGGRRRDSRPRGAGGLRRGQQEREHGPGEECEHVARSEPAAQEELLTVQLEQRPSWPQGRPVSLPAGRARAPTRNPRRPFAGRERPAPVGFSFFLHLSPPAHSLSTPMPRPRRASSAHVQPHTDAHTHTRGDACAHHVHTHHACAGRTEGPGSPGENAALPANFEFQVNNRSC